jgi:hypothetical protein
MDGLYYCNLGNNDREEILNQRISSRNIPSATLQPQFTLRPVSTKYSLLPILDRRAVATEKIHQSSIFNTNGIFNPGTAQAPWSGFSSKINVESDLKNINFALQKADQAHYIPDSTSDMYNNVVPSTPIDQPFPGLFEKPILGNFDPNTHSIGQDTFNNHTRHQLKNTAFSKS